MPWTGVDPYADSLEQPTILAGGMMKPLSEGPGFGSLLNRGLGACASRMTIPTTFLTL